MSLEECFSGRDAPRFLQLLSDCLQSLGTEEFNAGFLDLIESVVKADQCMIFSYRGDRPECYLSFNRRQSDTAANLAQKYLRSSYREDPVIKYLGRLQPREMLLLSLSDLRAEMPEEYFHSFFATSQIVDKIVVIVRTEQESLALNFYRFKESGPVQPKRGHTPNTLLARHLPACADALYWRKCCPAPQSSEFAIQA
ncbi:hypothetical protein N5C66_25980 [Rhizobium pusense]|uniref:hypothetical protein n=1 Tax=Agrobacterium pusense TaxID=648995 RepID=UPI001300B677|nr:hypothetical protein [Agrobacterium pusense]MDH0912515.1 hypothetical protein [Agrobacterium pusense]MDH1098868.1 hypothetical protein [Agrobacterium pusense]MDH1115161.1 hypothetical protein [Agrobacterium pusense]MDH2196967.1 hypothetical protein [Agrobacterium pusense]